MAEAPRGEVPQLAVGPKGPSCREEKPKDSCIILDILCLAVSAAVLVADLGTDIVLFAEYWTVYNVHWALSTFLLILAPNAVVQVLSLRWHVADSTATIWHWISHVGLAGLFHRYITLFKCILSPELRDKWSASGLRGPLADLRVLNLFRTFLQSAPQVVLQSYYCIASHQHSHVRAVSLVMSLVSLLWMGAAYGQRGAATRSVRWLSVLLRSGWFCGMLAARLAALVLFTVVFGLWTLVPLGIHWAAMTVWITSQKTEFCPTRAEELFYNIVIGFIYCFCYFNLQEGRTRYRLVTFYTLTVTQNFASLFLFVLISEVAWQRRVWAVLATVCIVCGTVVGMCSMLSYYRWFHPKGPITWNNMVDDDIELNNKDSTTLAVRRTDKCDASGSYKSRSLKNCSTVPQDAMRPGSGSQEVSTQPEIGSTDKKFLLDHWIARSGTPTFVSAPVCNAGIDLSGIELHTVENTPQSTSITLASENAAARSKTNNRKKVGICSPTELNLKLSSIEHMERSIDDFTSSTLTLQKRRGICSSDELEEELQQMEAAEHRTRDRGSELSHDTDSSNKKTSSDSIDMDLELSFSDVNSSDINEFNENIVQKLCLSTLKNIKVGNQDADIQNIQRIALDILKEMYAKKGKHRKVIGQEALVGSKRDLDTPTEIISVHDYENICAVNIAREAWGLRSWNVYSDIESWRHDGSVVRDRRRDTLTSASSEISSCISHELRHHILSAAAPPPRIPTYSNVFVDRQHHHEYASDLRSRDDDADISVSSVKPCVVESAVSHLEPILEEIDDLGDVEQPSKPRLNSESSLVATIDEIRKGTITNSPRNVYHRREDMWDSPQMNAPVKIESSLKRALWKEPSKFNPSNILESLQEKENIVSEFSQSKFSPRKPAAPDLVLASALSFDPTKSGPQNCRKNVSSQKMTNLRSQFKNNNTSTEEIHDLSNKDVDFLWQLVSDNSIPLQLNSTEDLSASHITSSLQSLILKESVAAPVVNVGTTVPSSKSNLKKSTRNRPKRKFSLLREHFEPKLAKVDDEEALYRHYENKSSPPQSGPVFDVRFQNKLSRCPLGSQNERTARECAVEPKLKDAASGAVWGRTSPRNIKEKRSLFLKQVLSPPKFNTKTRHKT